MVAPSKQLEEERERLLERLTKIGEFRRGSISVTYHKCGKERCVCMQKGHPGHGPLTMLTFKKKGKTITRALRTRVAIELVQQQIRRHDEFLEWYKQWRDLNEKISDMKLQDVLCAAAV